MGIMRTRMLGAAGGLLLLLTAGCGRVVDTAAPDASPMSDGAPSYRDGLDAGSSTDACDAPGFACPMTLPVAGGPCAPSPQECEYGPSPYLACNTLARCADDGDGGRSWTVAEVDTADGGPCALQTAACGDTEAVLHGGACPIPATESYLECDVPGETCSCNATTAWSCQAVGQGCPGERPRLGSPCCTRATPAGTVCAHAMGLGLACENGNWASRPNP